MIKKLIYTFLLKHPSLGIKFNNTFGIRCHTNINLDFLNPKQKKILLCYLDLERVDFGMCVHANRMHFYQILKCLIDMGYCIDVCACEDELAYELLKDRKYDMVIGQGKVFKIICKHQPNVRKILFVTENDPMVAIKKYAERISYFKQRHPNVNYHHAMNRIGYNGYIDEEMFMLADLAIVMTSTYNTNSMRRFFDNIYTINCNALFNVKYIFDAAALRNNIEQTKRNFLWFGSAGLIHKGGDILVDAFKEMPECSVDFYGITGNEKKLFDKLKVANTIDCGYINVQELEFIEKLVNRHCFIIFPSCSEGMSTAVATCMAHGIIPIITKECGFNSCECIIELDGWQIEDIKNAVKRVIAMSDEEILNLRKRCYEYAHENFSLECFHNSFKKTMQSIVEKV